MNQDSIYRDALQAFEEHMHRLGDRPESDAIECVILHARQNANDPQALYWASYAAFSHWTLHEQIDGPVLLKRAAELGYAPAVRDLAIRRCIGETGISQDPARGLPVVKQIAESGDARALYALAYCHAAGIGGLESDLNVAQKYADGALQKGYYPAALLLAQVCATKGDRAQSEQYYIRAADLGDVDAMEHLVQRYVAEADSGKLRRYLIRGTLSRSPRLTRMLAANILLGKLNWKQDEPLAVYLLRRAAVQDDGRAQAILARARLEGTWGVERQPERGYRELRWLAEGADGSGAAAFALGKALCDGIGMPSDATRGVASIRKSADVGFEPAKKWLQDRNSDSDTKPANSRISGAHPTAEQPGTASSTQDSLLEAATNVGVPPSASATPPSMTAEDQRLEDNDEFHDWWYLETVLPAPSVITRVVDRPLKSPADIRSLTWASLAAMRGLTTNDEARVHMIDRLETAARAGDSTAADCYGACLLVGDHCHQDRRGGGGSGHESRGR